MKKILYLAVCVMGMLTAFFFCACQPAHTHRWTLQETISATCEKSGGELYACACGARKTTPIPAKGHDWWEVDSTDTAVCWICLHCFEEKWEMMDSSSSEEISSDKENSSSSEESSSVLEDSSSSEEISSETESSSSSEEISSETESSSSSEEISSAIEDSSSSEESSSDTEASSSKTEDSSSDDVEDPKDPFDKSEAEKVRFDFAPTEDGLGYVCRGLENCDLKDELRMLVIPDYYLEKPVLEIAPHAFAEFAKLNCVYLGKYLRKIGEQAFFECYNLVEIHNYYGLNLERDPEHPEAYSNILDYAFAVYETPTDSRIVRDENGYVTYCCEGRKQLIGYDGEEIDLVLPEDVTGLNRDVFVHIIRLKSVVIGDKVTEIGTYVFLDCITLESVTFGEGLRRIALRAFQGCDSLQYAYFAQTYGWGLESGMIFTTAELAIPMIMGSYLHSEFYQEPWVWYGELYGQ